MANPHDLGTKMPSYARMGIAYAWIADVGARLVTAHRLESGRWVTVGTYTDEIEARIEPFDTVPLNITEWWPPGARARARTSSEVGRRTCAAWYPARR